MAASLSPRNSGSEISTRLIACALYHRRPVYLAIPSDVADQEILGSAQPLEEPHSNPDNVRAATEAIVSALDRADTACILPGMLGMGGEKKEAAEHGEHAGEHGEKGKGEKAEVKPAVAAPVYAEMPEIIANLDAGPRRASFVKMKPKLEIAKAAAPTSPPPASLP